MNRYKDQGSAWTRIADNVFCGLVAALMCAALIVFFEVVSEEPERQAVRVEQLLVVAE